MKKFTKNKSIIGSNLSLNKTCQIVYINYFVSVFRVLLSNK